MAGSGKQLHGADRLAATLSTEFVIKIELDSTSVSEKLTANKTKQLEILKAVAKDGDLLIADTWNHCVRRIDPKTEIITTFAGTGRAGFAGDGGGATDAEFDYVMCISLDPAKRTLPDSKYPDGVTPLGLARSKEVKTLLKEAIEACKALEEATKQEAGAEAATGAEEAPPESDSEAANHDEL